MGTAASRQSTTFLQPHAYTHLNYAFGPINTSQASGHQASGSIKNPHIHSDHQAPVDPALWYPDINPGHSGSSYNASSSHGHHPALSCAGQAFTRQGRTQHGGNPGPFLEWRLYNEQYFEQLKAQASYDTPTRAIMSTNNHTNQAVLAQGNSSLNEAEAYSYPQTPPAQNALPAVLSQPKPFTGNTAQLPVMHVDSSSDQATSQPSFSPTGTTTPAGYQSGTQNAQSHRSVARWTDAEVQQAQSMQAQGMRTEDIASVLGKSESAVTAKLWRKSGKDPHAAKKQRRA